MVVPDIPPTRRAPQGLELTWLQPMGMVALSLINFALRILTLGIYDFWARTEVRKRLWSAIRLNGEPLVYTGTGKELFLGFLIVFGVVLLPILIVTVGAVLVFGPNSPIAGVIQFLIYLGIVMLFGVAVYRAQRYRLLRTNWRGIRGNLQGSSWNYGWTYFWTLLLIPFTLGWIIPWRTTKLQSLITRDARFGDKAFAFQGDSGPLYGPFAVLWFGIMALTVGSIAVVGTGVVVLQQTLGPDALDASGQLREDYAQLVGLGTILVFLVAYLFYLMIGAWYRARTINHFAACTQFETAGFQGSATGLGLLWIDLSNVAILLIGALIVLVPLSLLGAVAASLFAGVNGIGDGQLSDPQVAASLLGVAAPLLLLVVALSFTLLLPVTQARSMGYLIDHVSLEGALDVSQIEQGNADPMTTGEGLAQAFDVDAF